MKKLKRYFQVTVSVVLLFVIISWIDFKEVADALKNINYWFLILAFLTLTIDRILKAFNWNLLLKVKNINLSLYEATKIYYISSFLGLILPATVGADIVKTHLVAKKKYSLADIIASILIERLLGFLGLFVYGLIAVFIFVRMLNDLHINFDEILLGLIILSITGVVVLILSFNDKAVNIIINGLKSIEHRKFWNKISSRIQKLILSYQSYKTRKSILLLFFTMNLIEVFTSIFISFLIALGLNLNVPLAYFVAYIPIMMLLVRLPISFSGIGIVEGGAIYFLGLVGVSKALGFSVGLITDFIILVGLLPGGIFYALNRSEAKMEIAELEKEKILVER